MGEVRARPGVAAEMARAEREFFGANPAAPRSDPAALQRFCEWYLLERESEVLGDVPARCLPMEPEEREALATSLVGVFLVRGQAQGEYVVDDLQTGQLYELAEIEDVPLEAGDVLVGRLYDGALDTMFASAALARQRDAIQLAEAFRRDVAGLALDRRLTQAELEHLMFRGRGTGEVEGESGDPPIPLERLEAELERCLDAGGFDTDALPATAISGALRDAPKPGMVADPLLEKIAFDTTVDLALAQRLMLAIWQSHRSAPARSNELQPPDPIRERPNLGESVAERIRTGLARHQGVEELFGEVEEMVGAEPEEAVWAAPHEGGIGDLADEGDLRGLVEEYRWELGERLRDGDAAVLARLVATQCEAAVPVLDLESIDTADLLRLHLQVYLEQPPGERSAAVGEVFAAVSRFFAWAEETQGYALTAPLAEVRSGMVDQVARLEVAGVALTHDAAAWTARPVLLRVVAVQPERIEVARDEEDELLFVPVPERAALSLVVGDLLLGALEVPAPGEGVFHGVVVALPAMAEGLLGG
ncbi:MAG: hypothetical protein H6836_03410 [Planctomycetes bacterium]|nr:hypothetical protein [Planctomycetota bacterium]